MRPTLIACAVLALAACKTAPPAPMPPAASQAPAPTADANLNAVLWVQTSAEYRATCASVYHAAAAALDAALKRTDGDALVPEDRVATRAARKPAVVLDIDETVLDNSPYQARKLHDGGSFDPASWDAWVNERQARPLPGVLDFARAASARGVTLVYVSNRTMAQREATLANLRAVGLPVADDSVYLGVDLAVPGCSQDSASAKSCRRRLVAGHYRVLMQFGDQLGDFVEPAANTREAHAAAFERYQAWFGERWFMLPNPTYGSWESRYKGADREAAKRAALELAR